MSSQAKFRTVVMGVCAWLLGFGVTAAQTTPSDPLSAVVIAVPNAIAQPSDQTYLGGREQLGQIRLLKGDEGQEPAVLVVLNPSRLTPHALRIALLTARAFRDEGMVQSNRVLALPVMPVTNVTRRRAAGLAWLVGEIRGRAQEGELPGIGTARWVRFDDLDHLLAGAGEL